MKRFYLRQIAKGKSPQDAQVAAARKLACIVWKILTSKQRYVEEDRYLTSRKMTRLSQIAGRPLEHTTKPEDVSILVGDLKSRTSMLEMLSRGDGSHARSSKETRRKQLFKSAYI